MKKIKFKFILSLILILALALPLFIMPISAADKEPTIEELVELIKESEIFLDLVTGEYPYLCTRPEEEMEQWQVEYRQLAIKWGYIVPGFDIGDKIVHPFDAVNIKTGEITEEINTGYLHAYPDTVTVDKIQKDIEKYFVSDFLNILYDPDMNSMYAVLRPDGHLYFRWYGMGCILDHIAGMYWPKYETARIINKSDKKITLEFDSYAIFDPKIITIEFRNTDRGWRISGATGNYYNLSESVFAPEVPETADNSVVYIALASVSLVALAGVTLVSAKKKKEYIA